MREGVDALGKKKGAHECARREVEFHKRSDFRDSYQMRLECATRKLLQPVADRLTLKAVTENGRLLRD